MPALTRRREPDRQQEFWHIYYGDTPVGRITERAGLPHDVDQWEWRVGFYPVTHHRPVERSPGDTAATFDEARAALETAWPDYIARCTDADFAENGAPAPSPYENTGCTIPAIGCRHASRRPVQSASAARH